MKEKNKTLKVTLAILVVILISLISFGGIFVKDKNRMKNLLPEYQLGIEFDGARRFSMKPDETAETKYYDSDGNEVDISSIEDVDESEYTKEEIPVNSEEILNKENFDKSKEIIEKRLELLGVNEYEVRENEENGELYISIPENKYTDTIISQMTVTGNFKITDSEDEGNVLITSDEIKDVKVGYGEQTTGKTIFINIQFNKEGTKKLQEISREYTTADEDIDEADENVDEADENVDNTQKQINLILDDDVLLTTTFSEEIKDGLLKLTIGSTSTTSTEEELQDSLTQASNLAVLLKTEALPITYVGETNLFINSDINESIVHSFIIASIIVLAILIIFAIFRYKKIGLLAMISLIGFIAILLITLRYTNVVLSITGILAIALSVIMSYLFIIKILKERRTEENAFHKVSYQFLTIYLPLLIISVVFSFIKYLPIASFGMVMFYSLMLMIIYHGIITRTLIINSENKNN